MVLSPQVELRNEQTRMPTTTLPLETSIGGGQATRGDHCQAALGITWASHRSNNSNCRHNVLRMLCVQHSSCLRPWLASGPKSPRSGPASLTRMVACYHASNQATHIQDIDQLVVRFSGTASIPLLRPPVQYWSVAFCRPSGLQQSHLSARQHLQQYRVDTKPPILVCGFGWSKPFRPAGVVSTGFSHLQLPLLLQKGVS